MDDLESSMSINVSVSDNSDSIDGQTKLENDFLDDDQTDDGSEYEKSSTLKIQDSFVKEVKSGSNDDLVYKTQNKNLPTHGKKTAKEDVGIKSKSKYKFSVILYWLLALGIIVSATVIAVLIGGKYSMSK